MAKGFGPYEPAELAKALSLASEDDREQAYWEAMERYRAFAKFYDDEQRTNPDKALQPGLERDRRTLHEQVMAIGHGAGKPGREVFADLVAGRRTLASFNLPEFETVLNKDVADDSYRSWAEDGTEPKYVPTEETVAGVEGVRVVRGLRGGDIGVVFARRISNRVPVFSELRSSLRHDGYTRYGGPDVRMESRGERERVRRAARLAKELGVSLLIGSTFSHNYSADVIALVVDESTINRAAGEIRNGRSEYGIRLGDMDADVVERDWKEYEREIAGLGPETRRVYDHLYRKLHDPNYRVTDAQFVGMGTEPTSDRLREEDDEDRREDWAPPERGKNR